MFTMDVLRIDPAAEAARVVATLRDQVQRVLRRRGVVLGVSGGIDSAVCLALSVRAFGPGRVLPLLMPERDSSPDSLRLGQLVCAAFGVSPLVEDLTQTLKAVGCYARQAEAIRQVVPAYDERWRCKLTLPALSADGRLNVSRLVVETPCGERRTVRLPAASYRQLVAASSFKQRTRKMLEYYHADRLHHAVVGTPNRLELDQGFFVKQGDGAADLKPIAHLFKSQVYQLAEHLGVPGEVCAQAPTTDTWSLPQTQEEFFFALPHGHLDACLYAVERGISAEDVARGIGLPADVVQRAFADIAAKRRTTRPLHLPPLRVDDAAQARA